MKIKENDNYQLDKQVFEIISKEKQTSLLIHFRNDLCFDTTR